MVVNLGTKYKAKKTKGDKDDSDKMDEAGTDEEHVVKLNGDNDNDIKSKDSPVVKELFKFETHR